MGRIDRKRPYQDPSPVDQCRFASIWIAWLFNAIQSVPPSNVVTPHGSRPKSASRNVADSSSRCKVPSIKWRGVRKRASNALSTPFSVAAPTVQFVARFACKERGVAAVENGIDYNKTTVEHWVSVASQPRSRSWRVQQSINRPYHLSLSPTTGDSLWGMTFLPDFAAGYSATADWIHGMPIPNQIEDCSFGHATYPLGEPHGIYNTTWPIIKDREEVHSQSRNCPVILWADPLPPRGQEERNATLNMLEEWTKPEHTPWPTMEILNRRKSITLNLLPGVATHFTGAEDSTTMTSTTMQWNCPRTSTLPNSTSWTSFSGSLMNAGQHDCPFCDNSFEKEWRLQYVRHDITSMAVAMHKTHQIRETVRTVHGRRFSCPYSNCGYKCCKEADLQRHIRSVHQQKRDFFCDITRCARGLGGTGFGRKDALIRHFSSKKHALRVWCTI